MTPEQFIDLAFQISCEHVLELIADGDIPANVGSFSALHDHIDANCLGGFCDDDLNPIFEAIFPRTTADADDYFPYAFMEAVATVQDRVDAWIKAEDGMRKDLATARAASGA
jgi:hypothetical protein